MMKLKSRGQVWIETVIYILIGLGLIALVLAFVVPKINQEKDRIAIEQTISSLNLLDDKINEVIESGIGNKRIVDFSISRGELFIRANSKEQKEDKIEFVIKGLTKPYSEFGKKINLGRVTVETTEGKKTHYVNLTLMYGPGVNLQFAGGDEEKKFSIASTPYKFSIEYKNVEDVLVEGVNYKRHLINIDLV